MRARFLFGVLLLGVATSVLTCFFSPPVHAEEGNFSLQVTPSPLVTTVKPGVPTDLELKIHNGSTGTENLKIEARAFTFDDTTGSINLSDNEAPEIAPWLSFSAPTFSTLPGQWFTEKIHVALPKDTGFSYSFALIISRQANPTSTSGGRLLKGSVAVFTLVNVDRPGATRGVDLVSLSTDRLFYEFLPTTFNIKLKNTGNTIVQPYGNLFVQRNTGDTNPLSTLPVNDAKAYLLPGTTRTLSVKWEEGFPTYKTSSGNSGTTQTSLAWNVDHISKFRIGRYTAKVVAVYNDGTRDVPITGEVSFWVVPWRAILIIIVIIVVFVLAMRYLIKVRTARAVRKALEARGKS